MTGFSNAQNNANGAIPVWIVAGPGSPSGGSNVTVGDAFTVTTGGTAVNAIIAANGGIITNPANASESLWVDPINAAGTAAPGTNGTTFEVPPGQSFSCFPGNTSVNAVSSNHTFTCIKW